MGLEQGVRVVLPVRGGHEDEADLIAQAVPDHRPIQGPTATEDQLVDVEDLPDLAHCFRHVQMLLARSEEHTSELQSRGHLVCRLLLEKKNKHLLHIPYYSNIL